MSILLSRKKRSTPAGAAVSLREQRSMLCENLNFTAAESYKQLRANMLFALPNENKCRIVGVTSSIRGEGKSTTSINLAYTIAETGKRVILIDADMRLPSVAKKLAAESRPGLSNVLAGLCTIREAAHPSFFMDNWQIMPAGDIPPNPSELLGSEKMEKLLSELAESYDFIVVDLPPVDIVSDALAISHWVSGIIVVVRSNYTDRRSVSECMRQLGVLRGKLLGFVVTGVEEHRKEYGRYGKKYYKSGYGYGYDKPSREVGDGAQAAPEMTAAAPAKTAAEAVSAPSEPARRESSRRSAASGKRQK